jgi:argininosuccinate lyase
MRESLGVNLNIDFAEKVLLPGTVEQFNNGYTELIYLNKAYALMLYENKIINLEEVKLILNGLYETEKSLKVEDLTGLLEDLYFNFEHEFLQNTGEVGGKLHAGRSRNDIHSTLTRMIVRKKILDVSNMVLEFMDTINEKSKEHIDTVITGYTHLQPAQPITFGHYCQAITNFLSRNIERLFLAYNMTNLSPFGAAALAGTGFDIDRELLRELLGFDKVLVNTLDCVASRDYILDFESACAILLNDISRVAEDLYVWATYENGIVKVPGEVSICSSIMPQKRNPVSLEYSRAKSGHALAAFISSFTTLKGIPYTNSMDIFETLTLLFTSIDHVMQTLLSMNLTFKGLEINKVKAIEHAKVNLCTVTNLADELVKEFKLPFRQAHHIIGIVVAEIIEKDLNALDITADRITQIAKEEYKVDIVLDNEKFKSVLDPGLNVNTKKGIGGPSYESTLKMIEITDNNIKKYKVKIQKMNDNIKNAYNLVDNKISTLLNEYSLA